MERASLKWFSSICEQKIQADGVHGLFLIVYTTGRILERKIKRARKKIRK